jgi:hypothetical protein
MARPRQGGKAHAVGHTLPNIPRRHRLFKSEPSVSMVGIVSTLQMDILMFKL